jgi:hypothetical protein
VGEKDERSRNKEKEAVLHFFISQVLENKVESQKTEVKAHYRRIE